MEKFHEWKVKNPIVAGLLVWIIAILVETHIIVPAATEIGQTIKRAVVREEPNTNSVVISQVEEAHNVLIIDAVPYYYYVEFNDPVSNELLCGYISKKSVFHLSDDASAVMESEAGE